MGRTAPVLSRRPVAQDLAWAGLILLLAAALGIGYQWQLVRLSWTGDLPAHLEEQRQQRREVEFQGVKTLNLSQTYDIFQGGQALFVDARDADEFAELHITGAVNLSLDLLARQGDRALAGLARDRRIVVYCGQANCNKGLEVAEKLQSLKFTQVSAFLEGFQAWDRAGYPAETDK
ncbi:MAG: rhodanese-like domain-containing protein [Desulfobaccales bacterium]